MQDTLSPEEITDHAQKADYQKDMRHWLKDINEENQAWLDEWNRVQRD